MIPARLVDEWAVEHATPLPAPAGQPETPAQTPDERRMDEGCRARWPGAEHGAYDPRCCRFPKSCSVPPPPEPEHVHDPFTAWREDGIPYATCECGQTWERTTCTYCPAIVTALHVVQHGPAHKHCAAKKNATERTNP